MPRKRNSKVKVTNLQVAIVPKKKEKKAKGKRKPRAPAGDNTYSQMVRDYVNRLLFPGIAPVAPMPRLGGSARLQATMDRTFFSVNAPTVAGNCGCVYFVTNCDNTQAVAYQASGGLNAGYPSGGSMIANFASFLPLSYGVSTGVMQDWNCSAASLTARYLGNPLNAQGEIIIGSIPLTTPLSGVVSGSSYNSLKLYPGVRTYSVADWMEQGFVAVALTKASPRALELTTDAGQDMQIGFIAYSGMPTAGFFSVEIVRTFDYRAIAAQAVSIYSTGTSDQNSRVQVEAFEDASQEVNAAPSAVYTEKTPLFNNMIKEGLATFGSLLLGLPGASHYVHQALTGNLARLRLS